MPVPLPGTSIPIKITLLAALQTIGTNEYPGLTLLDLYPVGHFSITITF